MSTEPDVLANLRHLLVVQYLLVLGLHEGLLVGETDETTKHLECFIVHFVDVLLEEVRISQVLVSICQEANIAGRLSVLVEIHSILRQFFRRPALLCHANSLMGVLIDGEVELHALPAQFTGSSRDEKEVSGQVADTIANRNSACHIVPECTQLIEESHPLRLAVHREGSNHGATDLHEL